MPASRANQQALQSLDPDQWAVEFMRLHRGEVITDVYSSHCVDENILSTWFAKAFEMAKERYSVE